MRLQDDARMRIGIRRHVRAMHDEHQQRQHEHDRDDRTAINTDAGLVARIATGRRLAGSLLARGFARLE